MAVHRRSTRPRFTLLLLVLTSITLLTLDYRADGTGVLGAIRGGARDVLAPLQDGADAVVEPLSNVVQGIVHRGDLERENARLRAQLEAERGSANRAADAERERRALLDIMDLPFLGDIPSVAARVTSTASSSFEMSVVIDRGTAHGLTRGLAVVSASGLVGRVAQVSRQRAVVVLLTDLRSSVGIRLTSSGEVGVARGRGGEEPLRVELIDPSVRVAKREVVVTSGLQQSIYPPGIPVGRVRSARVRHGRLEQDVTVDPVVDLRRLAFVRVLQWAPGG